MEKELIQMEKSIQGFKESLEELKIKNMRRDMVGRVILLEEM
jgi:hypothetical protein